MADKSRSLTDQIDALCDEFEQAWLRGERPQLEMYLRAVPDAGRERLFQELLMLEYDYRRTAGEPPRIESYQQLFPQYQQRIAEVFAAVQDRSPRDTLPRSSSDKLPSRQQVLPTPSIQPPSPMKPTLDQFAKLLSQSGLMTSQELSAFQMDWMTSCFFYPSFL